jgi:hypothetical protein
MAADAAAPGTVVLAALAIMLTGKTWIDAAVVIAVSLHGRRAGLNRQCGDLRRGAEQHLPVQISSVFTAPCATPRWNGTCPLSDAASNEVDVDARRDTPSRNPSLKVCPTPLRGERSASSSRA